MPAVRRTDLNCTLDLHLRLAWHSMYIIKGRLAGFLAPACLSETVDVEIDLSKLRSTWL